MVPAKYNVRSMLVRKATTVATAIGVALVVWVLGSVLMLNASIRRTLGSSGTSDVAIVVRKGSDAELASTMETPEASLIRAAPGIQKDAAGKDLVTNEVVVVIALDKLGTDGVSNVTVRGLGEEGVRFRPNLKIVAGRAPAPGSDEAMIGARIRGRFKNVELDQAFEIRKNRPLKIVGVFEDGASSYESEVWADVDTVRTAFGRTGYSSVRARLTSPAAFDGFKAQVESDKRLGLAAWRENEFYEKQSEGLGMFIGMLGTLMAFFISIGAVIGAMITMYSAVANRTREVGVLRALGFSRAAILFSFLLESVTLALFGGVIGVAACMGMSVIKVSMINFSSWSEMVFTFEPTPFVLIASFAVAVIMGLIGGLLPAIRAALISPVTAMRGG